MKKDDIKKHNKAVLKDIIGEPELKTGTKEVRQAYFKAWYESCKDIYNKERRRKRKEKKHGNS